jgi:hypothetical protein
MATPYAVRLYPKPAAFLQNKELETFLDARSDGDEIG